MSNYIPPKIDLTPRRHHGYAFLLFLMGTLFPPLAVAARFGLGKDFWLNLLLTLCGYIPGHVHNFYIQNIRNNKNHARTPKWAQRYGLVDVSEIKRKERKSQWATRYNERLPRSTLEGQPYEEGEEPGSSADLSVDGSSTKKSQKQSNGELWRPEDESYYGTASNSNTSLSGRWHYPANFDDAALGSGVTKKERKKKKEKKDRWARTEDAYSLSEQQSQRKKKKKRRSSTTGDSLGSRESSTVDFPEAAEGGLYGDKPLRDQEETPVNGVKDDPFDHQF